MTGKPKLHLFVWLIPILSVVIVGLVLWWDLLSFLFFLTIASTESNFDQREATRIVSAIVEGKLRPNADGEVILPRRWASVTRTGRVWVTRKSKGLVLILFPTWEGKAWNVRGYLFCGRPLTRNDTHLASYGGKDTAIDITYNTYLVPAPRLKTPVEVEVILERKVGAGWYYVSRGLD